MGLVSVWLLSMTYKLCTDMILFMHLYLFPLKIPQKLRWVNNNSISSSSAHGKLLHAQWVKTQCSQTPHSASLSAAAAACFSLEGRRLWLCVHGQTGSGWVVLIWGGCFLSATSQPPLSPPPKTRPDPGLGPDPGIREMTPAQLPPWSLASMVAPCHLSLRLPAPLLLSCTRRKPHKLETAAQQGNKAKPETII